MRPLGIGNAVVGPGRPCYVIAEAGVNHDGRLDDARELVRAACAAGADAVKFQLFRASELVTGGASKARYQRETTDPGESQAAMLERLELPEGSFRELSDLARELGIEFLCTGYSERAVDVLDAIPVAAFKIASAQIVEPALLARAAGKGRPLLISVGMTTLEEIERALAVVRAAGDPPVALLQCTTEYPTAIEDANVLAIPALASRFDVPVGFSDHTAGDTACVAAVALGAAVVEKHLTLDRTRPGPDHAASLEPDELESLIARIRETEAALGSADRTPTAQERDNAFHMRRSLHAAVAIPAGTRIEPEHIVLRRPATGFPPGDFERVIGATAAADIARGSPLSADNVRP